jgi:fluoroacetyl-CoA thioesterase
VARANIRNGCRQVRREQSSGYPGINQDGERRESQWERREASRWSSHPNIWANRFKDAMLPPVLATPTMVLVMENAALNAVVDARHLAATPVGQHVRAEAEVTELDGRRIVFAVTAGDEVEEIGRGTHERMVLISAG